MTDKSFPLLIWRLARDRHDGALLRMALHSKIPQTTLWRWVTGVPTTYRNDLLRRLCDIYDLSLDETWALIARDGLRRLKDQDVPLPDMSETQRGPVPAGGRRRR